GAAPAPARAPRRGALDEAEPVGPPAGDPPGKPRQPAPLLVAPGRRLARVIHVPPSRPLRQAPPAHNTPPRFRGSRRVATAGRGWGDPVGGRKAGGGRERRAASPNLAGRP